MGMRGGGGMGDSIHVCNIDWVLDLPLSTYRTSDLWHLCTPNIYMYMSDCQSHCQS